MRLAPLVLPTGMGGAGNGSAIEGRRQARPMKLGIKQRHALAVPAAAGSEGATQLLDRTRVRCRFDRGAGQPRACDLDARASSKLAASQSRWRARELPRAGAALSRLKVDRNGATQAFWSAHELAPGCGFELTYVVGPHPCSTMGEWG
jgi:hypothetical protein